MNLLDDLQPAELGRQVEDILLVLDVLRRRAALPLKTRAMSLMISSSASPSTASRPLVVLLAGLRRGRAAAPRSSRRPR